MTIACCMLATASYLIGYYHAARRARADYSHAVRVLDFSEREAAALRSALANQNRWRS